VIIRAGVGDPARFSLPAQLAMLIYPLTDIALASMLGTCCLMSRSPARIGLFVGAVLLTIGDIAYSARSARRPTPRCACRCRVGHSRFAVFASPPACPVAVRAVHPSDRVATCWSSPARDGAVWLARWRYMFRDTEPRPSRSSSVCFAGLLIIAEQLADVVPLQTLSDRLSDNITNLRTPRPNCAPCSTTSLIR
jgi:hypothetical protein